MPEDLTQRTLPSLEVECRSCQGNGGAMLRGCVWTDCVQCKGAGHIPTAAGRQVLELVRHNLHLFLAKTSTVG